MADDVADDDGAPAADTTIPAEPAEAEPAAAELAEAELAEAELAEAEAAEAEALAAAARARAKVLRLRLAAAGAADTDTAAPDTTVADAAADADADADDEVPITQEWLGGDSRGPIRTRVRPVRLAAATATLLVVAALLTATGWMAYQHHRTTRERHRTAEFEAAARQGVINMTSMDYRNAQSDFQRFLDSATGSLREDLQHQTNDFISTLQQAQVITEGTVTATAVESVTDDSAIVLVAAKETVQNTAGADQPPRSFRFSVTMARDGDRIKMEKVEFVP